MKDHRSGNGPFSIGNRDQAGQNGQNGMTINRVFPSKNSKKRSAQNGANGTLHQEDALSGNKAGMLRKRRKKLTKRQVFTRIGIVIVSMLLLLAIGVYLIWNYMFSGLNTLSPAGTYYPTEALTNPVPESKDITNILLLGTDSRDPAAIKGNSDSIIILTVDRKNNILKMTSIMRDCYVYIPGHIAPKKINAAYAYGGGELAMQTINNTFRLNIQKYMVVDFQSMADIVDIAGGVTLTITEAERQQINEMIPTDPVQEKGTLKLDGAQTVMYARIRHIDSDFERTQRQRDVLSALYLEFKQAGAISKAQMIQKGLSDIITNMTATEITSLGMDVLPTMANEILQLRLPLDGYYTVVSNSVWYMIVDYNRMIPKVYEFIYGATQPFDPVPTIPAESNKPASASKSSNVSSSHTSTSSSGASSSSASEEPTATDTPPASSSTSTSGSDSAS